MKRTGIAIKFIAFVLAASVLALSCSSSTMIQSSPSGAKLRVDGESVGTTPYLQRDSKIVGSTTSVRIEMEGYEPLITSFSKDEQADVGAIIGGVFFLVPFLWTMKYKPERTYELTPLRDQDQVVAPVEEKRSSDVNETSSMSTQLRELKSLLDDKVITQQEYEKEKAKILEAH